MTELTRVLPLFFIVYAERDYLCRVRRSITFLEMFWKQKQDLILSRFKNRFLFICIYLL
jgi:hypothetical protein